MSYGSETGNAGPAQSGIDDPLYYRSIANAGPANIDGARRGNADGHVDYGLNVSGVNGPERRRDVTGVNALGPSEHWHNGQ